MAEFTKGSFLTATFLMATNGALVIAPAGPAGGGGGPVSPFDMR